MTETAKFERQRFGAMVATIKETADGALEVLARNDGRFVLTVHNRTGETDRWEDMSITLEPKHFEMLGSIADAAGGFLVPPGGLPLVRSVMSEKCGQVSDIHYGTDHVISRILRDVAEAPAFYASGEPDLITIQSTELKAILEQSLEEILEAFERFVEASGNMAPVGGELEYDLARERAKAIISKARG